MMVCESEPPGFRPVKCAVLFHSFGADGGLIRPDRFEKALSLAAGTLRHLHSQGIPARWIADFNDWKPQSAGARTQVAACLENMARAVRAAGTEAHDLQAALAEIGEDEMRIVISDLPTQAWRAALRGNNKLTFVPEIPGSEKLREVRR
jgi:hypothetical protein